MFKIIILNINLKTSMLQDFTASGTLREMMERG